MSRILIPQDQPLPRRNFFGRASGVMLSATALGIMYGCESIAQTNNKSASQDVQILNTALGLEHEGINAYQLGAESGLLEKAVLAVALQFQADHKVHRDMLISTIQKLGGTPVAEQKLADYAKALKADTLKSQGDVLALAARLELGAINAYLGVIPAFKSGDLAKVSGRLAADETLHWTVLTQALGRALPTNAPFFGA